MYFIFTHNSLFVKTSEVIDLKQITKQIQHNCLSNKLILSFTHFRSSLHAKTEITKKTFLFQTLVTDCFRKSQISGGVSLPNFIPRKFEVSI